MHMKLKMKYNQFMRGSKKKTGNTLNDRND